MHATSLHPLPSRHIPHTLNSTNYDVLMTFVWKSLIAHLGLAPNPNPKAMSQQRGPISLSTSLIDGFLRPPHTIPSSILLITDEVSILIISFPNSSQSAPTSPHPLVTGNSPPPPYISYPILATKL